MDENNIVWHQHKVLKGDRAKIKGHNPCILWFTGLPSSGKSTIANELESALFQMGIHTYLLDGDNVRHGLNKNLGFSVEDRQENIRRIGEVAKLFVDAGVLVLTAFISPFTEDRQAARKLVKEGEFIEVYAKCSLDVCKERDPKGLYQKAINGKIKDFTGISHPYEEPPNPEIIIETDKYSVEECVKKIITYLEENNVINNQGGVNE